jgi:hypothetical protein
MPRASAPEDSDISHNCVLFQHVNKGGKERCERDLRSPRVAHYHQAGGFRPEVIPMRPYATTLKRRVENAAGTGVDAAAEHTVHTRPDLTSCRFR